MTLSDSQVPDRTEEKESISTTLKHCPSCYGEVKADAVKCEHCGRLLSSGSTPIENNPESNVKVALASKYEIVESLGKGEVCTVYRAIHRDLNKEVALEILPHHLAQSREYVDRFHREAHAASVLNHPNITKIFDEGVENGVHFIAVEYLDGTDLHTLIMWKGRLDSEESVNIITPAVEALAYAHERGILHRDIRSSNIMVTDMGRSVLTDFWIDHAFRGAKLAQAARVIGTLEYMSPEQAEGKELGRSSNIYCLGIVLYEALTGKVPFTGGNPFTTVGKIINSPPVPPRQISPSIPIWMEEIILKCLAKKPENRFSSAAELAGVLLRSMHPTAATMLQPSSDAIPIVHPKEKEHEKKEKPKRKGPITIVPKSSSESIQILQPGKEQIEEPSEIRKEKRNWRIPTKAFFKVVVPLMAVGVAIALILNHPSFLHLKMGNSVPSPVNKTRSEIPVVTRITKTQQTQPSNSTPDKNRALISAPGSAKQGTINPSGVPNKIISTSQEANASKETAERTPNLPKTIADKKGQPVVQPLAPDKVERQSQLNSIQWTFVEGGTFQMGSNDYPYTKPVHSVKVSGFHMSTTEITFDQYDKFCDATHTKKPNDNGWGRGKMPVVNVSWNDALAYCRWMSDQTGKTIRLPSEAEYEFAARGGNKSEGSQYSGTDNIGWTAWYIGNSGGIPHEVGTKAPNALGLYDMSGNVWEWCEDWYHQSYDKAPADGSAWKVEDRYNPYRVVRGGSAKGASYCSLVSFRFFLLPYFRDNVIGFRCVQEAK